MTEDIVYDELRKCVSQIWEKYHILLHSASFHWFNLSSYGENDFAIKSIKIESESKGEI